MSEEANPNHSANTPALKCERCNRAVKPGSANPPNPDYVPQCSLGGADMRKVYDSDTKEEWVCANLAPEAPITMDQYKKWKNNYMDSKFEHKKST